MKINGCSFSKKPRFISVPFGDRFEMDLIRPSAMRSIRAMIQKFASGKSRRRPRRRAAMARSTISDARGTTALIIAIRAPRMCRSSSARRFSERETACSMSFARRDPLPDDHVFRQVLPNAGAISAVLQFGARRHDDQEHDMRTCGGPRRPCAISKNATFAHIDFTFERVRQKGIYECQSARRSKPQTSRCLSTSPFRVHRH